MLSFYVGDDMFEDDKIRIALHPARRGRETARGVYAESYGAKKQKRRCMVKATHPRRCWLRLTPYSATFFS